MANDVLSKEDLLKIFENNWAHIRHMEQYRMLGVNLYAVVIAGIANAVSSSKLEPYMKYVAAFLIMFGVFNLLITLKIEAVISHFAKANQMIVDRLGMGEVAPVRTRKSGLQKIVRFQWLFPAFYCITLGGILVMLSLRYLG
jgi:hypothetical protein